MKITLLTSTNCYPCDRAKTEIYKVLREYPGLEIETVTRPHPAFPKYDVVYTPTLVIDIDGIITKVSGAHEIRKIEVVGLLKDLEIISC